MRLQRIGVSLGAMASFPVGVGQAWPVTWASSSCDPRRGATVQPDLTHGPIVVVPLEAENFAIPGLAGGGHTPGRRNKP